MEQVLAYRRGNLPPISTTEDTQRKHEQNLINSAQKVIGNIKKQQKVC